MLTKILIFFVKEKNWRQPQYLRQHLAQIGFCTIHSMKNKLNFINRNIGYLNYGKSIPVRTLRPKKIKLTYILRCLWSTAK